MSTQMETIEITGLPPGTRAAIDELSRSKGKSAEEYLRDLIMNLIQGWRFAYAWLLSFTPSA